MKKKLLGMVVETVEVASLRPHPRNYRTHDPSQIAHLVQSIKEHGLYRNVVIARDGTILAGHGVVEACKLMGIKEVDAVRIDVEPDDPRALKVLTGDNEISRMADIDDRMLTEVLKEIRDADESGLLGTGFDDAALAALVMVSRTSAEIKDFDAAAEWVGMPEFNTGAKSVFLTVNFRSEEDRDKFFEDYGLDASSVKKFTGGNHWSMWWPASERNDLQSLRLEQDESEPSP
jgi:ParB-like chromosome segregation protein Spo0J